MVRTNTDDEPIETVHIGQLKTNSTDPQLRACGRINRPGGSTDLVVIRREDLPVDLPAYPSSHELYGETLEIPRSAITPVDPDMLRDAAAKVADRINDSEPVCRAVIIAELFDAADETAVAGIAGLDADQVDALKSWIRSKCNALDDPDADDPDPGIPATHAPRADA